MNHAQHAPRSRAVVALAAAVGAVVCGSVQAQAVRDYISVVGSSTVYPFATVVAGAASSSAPASLKLLQASSNLALAAGALALLGVLLSALFVAWASIRALAVQASVDPRTIVAVIEGRPVRGMAGHRARAALVEAGLLPPSAGGQP